MVLISLKRSRQLNATQRTRITEIAYTRFDLQTVLQKNRQHRVNDINFFATQYAAQRTRGARIIEIVLTHALTSRMRCNKIDIIDLLMLISFA